VGGDSGGTWEIHRTRCDADDCQRLIVELVHLPPGGLASDVRRQPVLPKGAHRPLPPAVKEPFASEFVEACTVLPDSAKASAAISRRCLQTLLRDKVGIKERDLNAEIDKLLQSNQLPSYLADQVDAIRTVGNFAAHPIKSTDTGQVVDVEPGEAEWLLDVLEGLFDFYFVQPAKAEAKRNALNQKLQDAGKPVLK
jgi:hypothetical protein